MKKTLIALAVLAASGASFAQATVSGNLTMGYMAYSKGQAGSLGNTDTSGFGTDTSQINFNTTEDLGGGMKIAAQMRIAGADRSNSNGAAVVGKDAFLRLTTNGYGALTLGSTKLGDLSSGIASVGATYYQFDDLSQTAAKTDGLFYKRPSRDSVSYALPIGPVTLGVAYAEPKLSATSGDTGLGVGTAGSDIGQRAMIYTAGYVTGPIAANLTYASFDNHRTSSESTVKDQTRLEGAYDFGVAKVGLGYQLTAMDGVAGAKDTQILLGVSVPVGSLKLGANWGQRKSDDFTAASNNGTRTGYILGATYSLSKRTSIIGNYARWDAASGNQDVGATSTVGLNASNQFALLLSHSF
jgi:predicted porin